MTEQEKETAEQLAQVIFNILLENEVQAKSSKPIPCDHENGQDIKNPKHYQIIDDFESIDIIACSMTEAEFKGFCLGNIIKYRLRAGNKDSLEQDVAKADEYKTIFMNKKHLCREGKK